MSEKALLISFYYMLPFELQTNSFGWHSFGFLGSIQPFDCAINSLNPFNKSKIYNPVKDNEFRNDPDNVINTK